MQVPEFDLHFEKTTFKWVASSVAEKKAFIVCLYKMVHKYLLRSKPEFVHVDEKRLQELLTTAEGGGKGREIEEEAVQQGTYTLCFIITTVKHVYSGHYNKIFNNNYFKLQQNF